MALLQSVSISSPAIYLIAVALLIATAYYLHIRYAGLSHIPGPFLARYTDLWRAYQALKIDQGQGKPSYQCYLGEYGDIVRIGPNTVLINDPEAIPIVLGFKERLEKGPSYTGIRPGGVTGHTMVTVPDEKTHSAIRKPVAHAYSLSSLKGYESYIDETITTLVDVLDQKASTGEVINASLWCHFWAFDVISMLAFGKPLGFMSEGWDFNGMAKEQRALFRYWGVTSNIPIADYFLKRNPILNFFRGNKPSLFLKFAMQTVQERIELSDKDASLLEKAEGKYPDILAGMLAAQHQYPEALSNLRITLFSMGNVVAGGNTTALAMDVALQYFVKHPEGWERLYRETAEVQPDQAAEGPMAFDLAYKVPFLEAITTESLRMASVEASNLDRVISERGLTLPNGITLPPGTEAAVNPCAILRRKERFGEDAGEFNPLRWLKADGETDAQFAERKARMDKGMVQFGLGSRSCLGKNIAMLELYKIWPGIVKNFTLESVKEPGHRDVWVKVHKRSSTETGVKS